MAELVRDAGQGPGHRLADVSWPSEITPVIGTGRAFRTWVIRPARSLAVDDSRLRARRISPERQSRKTQRTSWPTSGCSPSMARMTRRWWRRQRLQPLGVGGGQGPRARRSGPGGW